MLDRNEAGFVFEKTRNLRKRVDFGSLIHQCWLLAVPMVFRRTQKTKESPVQIDFPSRIKLIRRRVLMDDLRERVMCAIISRKGYRGRVVLLRLRWKILWGSRRNQGW